MDIATSNRNRANRAYGSPDYYTPKWILERVERFLGEYHDPCPARYNKPLADNGLAQTWKGNVFCNPPYGAFIAPWIRKVVTEPVDELLLLVPAATDASWFAPLFEYTICFISGRIYFTKPDKSEARAPHASVLVYRGPRVDEFTEEFSDIGAVMRTIASKRPSQAQLWGDGF